jgi:predicted DNA-binding protein with PD1-like motif
MRTFESSQTDLVIALLEPGELLLEGLVEVVRQAGIHTGVLVSGIGSLSRARIHTISTNVNPVENLFLDIEGPLEVTNFTGLIADYEPHIHITMADPKMNLYAGHLEPGCQVLTLCEFSIRRITDLRLRRRVVPGREDAPYAMLERVEE